MHYVFVNGFNISNRTVVNLKVGTEVSTERLSVCFMIEPNSSDMDVVFRHAYIYILVNGALSLPMSNILS